jgi:PAS domain S-box-containing protein
VDSTTALNSLQDIHQRNQAIAHQWYLAIASVGCFQLDRSEALQKFSQLTDQVIAFLLAENPDQVAAREIGVGLASLPCIDPLAIEISGQLWAGQLAEDFFGAEPALVYLRFVHLLNGMANGFAERSRAIVLEEQEDIRSAMAADLLRTTEELRKYQSQLESMLAERTRELRESEEKFRAIAETSIEGIFQSTNESGRGKLLYVNDAYAKMLGYSKEELLERTSISLLSEVDLQNLPPIAQDVKSNKPVNGEFRLKHKDGHLVDVHFSVVPTMLNGNIVRSGIIEDITERKKAREKVFQSEERYRTLAEASPDMIYIIGQDNRVQYINSNAASFFNLPAEKIIGASRERFFSSLTSAHQKKNLMKVLKNGKKFYAEGETRTNDKSIWLGTWLVPLRDASGNISGVMGVSRDITMQKHTEMEILSSREQLEKLVEERTAELTTSQIQLRQLTNQLVTALEEERRRISRELHDEASQALISLKYNIASIESDIPENKTLTRQHLVDSMGIIDQVMSQIRTLTHSLRPPVLEIAGIDLSLKEYCEEITKRTGLSIHYQGEEIPGLPYEIGISLYRFVQEALTNILKHAHATQVEIRLQYRKKQIALTVSDNGRGMEDTAQSDGIGLIGIEERINLIGGFLQTHTRKGLGVKITAYVPWPRLEEEDRNR